MNQVSSILVRLDIITVKSLPAIVCRLVKAYERKASSRLRLGPLGPSCLGSVPAVEAYLGLLFRACLICCSSSLLLHLQSVRVILLEFKSLLVLFELVRLHRS